MSDAYYDWVPEDTHDYTPMTRGERERHMHVHAHYHVHEGAYCATIGVFIRWGGSWRSRSGEPTTALSGLLPVGFLPHEP
jgi:hypothetical protein